MVIKPDYREKRDLREFKPRFQPKRMKKSQSRREKLLHFLREAPFFSIGAFLSFVIGLLIADYLFMPLVVGKGNEIEVPDITEKTPEEARKILEKRDLTLVIDKMEERFDASVRRGYIIAQMPEAFSRAKRGRRVYAVLSRGGKLVEVPNIVGVSLRQAKLVLEQNGFELGAVREDSSLTMPKGVVVSQNPEAKKMIMPNVPINVVVSSGIKEMKPLMADLRGMSFEESKQWLKDNGLELGSVTYQLDSDFLPETVIGQSLQPETEIKRGQKVDLIVSKL